MRFRYIHDYRGRLNIVFQILRGYILYAKLSSCMFLLHSRALSGHIVKNVGIHVNMQKIEVMKTWLQPMTPIEVYRFLGLAGSIARVFTD